MITYKTISRQKVHQYLVISNQSVEEKLCQVKLEEDLFDLVYLTPKGEREIELPDDYQGKITIDDITR